MVMPRFNMFKVGFFSIDKLFSQFGGSCVFKFLFLVLSVCQISWHFSHVIISFGNQAHLLIDFLEKLVWPHATPD